MSRADEDAMPAPGPLSPVVAEMLGVVTRAALLALTGYLQKQHLLTADQGERFVAAAVAHVVVWAPGALALAWGIWVRYHGRKKLLVAMAQEGSMCENQVNSIVKNGYAPAVSTPRDAVPQTPGAER